MDIVRLGPGGRIRTAELTPVSARSTGLARPARLGWEVEDPVRLDAYQDLGADTL